MSAEKRDKKNRQRTPETDAGEETALQQEEIEADAAAEQQNEEAAQAEEATASPSDAESPEKLKEQLLRALAEVENTKKRAERDRKEFSKYAIAGFARDLLNVSDNLRRAMEALPENLAEENQPLKNFILGVEMTEKELLSALEKHGVQKIDAKGQPFDYNIHQAVGEIETDDYPPGTVVEQMQPGYVLHDRLLRPAMVMVAKGSGEAPPDGEIKGVDTTA